jgi:hypothetical protein
MFINVLTKSHHYTLNQINPVYNLPLYVFKIHFNIVTCQYLTLIIRNYRQL